MTASHMESTTSLTPWPRPQPHRVQIPQWAIPSHHDLSPSSLPAICLLSTASWITCLSAIISGLFLLLSPCYLELPLEASRLPPIHGTKPYTLTPFQLCPLPEASWPVQPTAASGAPAATARLLSVSSQGPAALCLPQSLVEPGGAARQGAGKKNENIMVRWEEAEQDCHSLSGRRLCGSLKLSLRCQTAPFPPTNP